MIDGGCHLKSGRVFGQRGERAPHLRVRPFLHGDTGAFKPALLLEMRREVFEKAAPEFVKGRCARLQGEIYLAVLLFIEVTELQRSSEHRITMDARVFHPAPLAHERYPAVEDPVITTPRAVGFFPPFDHRREAVVGLAVPWFFDDGTSDGFLPGGGKAFHRRR